jgi:hypothetical protein
MIITEAFIAGHRRYEIRLCMDEWYELWRDGAKIGTRHPWPFDPETATPVHQK